MRLLLLEKLKVEGLTFIPIKVRLLLLEKYIIFVFFLSLLYDTIVLLDDSFAYNLNSPK